MTPTDFRWIEPQSQPVPREILELVGEPPFISQALVRRGLGDPAALRAFLDPHCYRPAPPTDLPDLAKAADRLEQARANHEIVGVWGDFDVDGQTATALLVAALTRLGCDVRYHIPVRAQESHGVGAARLGLWLDEGIQLVLTCDTGITAHDAVALAAERGVDVLITDHHVLPEQLPPAYAVVNPQRLPQEHPLSPLCGVGTAYKLVEELYCRNGLSAELAGLHDLVALGTIADLAILRGENRWLVQMGLRALQTPRPAIAEMLRRTDIAPLALTEEDVSFTLAPRLNALGRLGDANPSVPFLLAQPGDDVTIQANALEALNARRKLLCDQVFQAAQAQIERERGLLDHPVLILSHASWPGGVLGIAASRLVEAYHRPVILLTAPPGEAARGSARSIEGVHITQAIASAAHLLHGYGGHAQAAGLSLDPAKIPALQRVLDEQVARQVRGQAAVSDLVIDAFLPLSEINLGLVEAIDRLAPFGPGNPALVFASSNLVVRSHSTFGRTQDHLRLVVEDAWGNQSSVIWWQGAGMPVPEGRFDLAYTLRAYHGRSEASVQIEWLHARTLPESLPLRDQRPIRQIVDLRIALDPLKELSSARKATDFAVFAEGQLDLKIETVDRNHVPACKALAIWTPPPGRRELSALLDRAAPEVVYWFGQPVTTEQMEPFLARLSGLVQFSIKRRAGAASLAALAAALAQGERTTRRGLDWLAAKGHVTLSTLADGSLEIKNGGTPDLNQASRVEKDLIFLLAETAAFREFCRKADLPALLNTRL